MRAPYEARLMPAGGRRQVLHAAAALAAACALPGCTTPAALAQALQALAPSGALRAAINYGNPLLAARDPRGAPQGVSVDLARELGRRLGVPVALVTHDNAGRTVEAVRTQEVDIAFVAIDPARATELAYSSAYLLIEGAGLVRADAGLRALADLDRPGLRIAVARGSTYDLHLSRTLQSAVLVRVATSQAVADVFLAQQLDAAVGVRQQMQADARRLGGLRLLEGSLLAVEQAVAMPRARGEAGHRQLVRLVEEIKATGFVDHALARHGIEGVRVAPPLLAAPAG